MVRYGSPSPFCGHPDAHPADAVLGSMAPVKPRTEGDNGIPIPLTACASVLCVGRIARPAPTSGTRTGLREPHEPLAVVAPRELRGPSLRVNRLHPSPTGEWRLAAERHRTPWASPPNLAGWGSGVGWMNVTRNPQWQHTTASSALSCQQCQSLSIVSLCGLVQRLRSLIPSSRRGRRDNVQCG